jgi:NAD(P)-dependent dehydrogenase (short-subunit alcohol dehydrogenase family)
MPTAFVTGGGGALGRGIGRALIDKGWQVVLADLKPEHAEEVAAALGKGATPTTLNVNEFSLAKAAIDKAAKDFGGLDALVNCAGGTMALRVPKGTLVENDPEHWDRMINVNLFGTFNCAYAAAAHMKAAKCGGIVNIASGAGMRGGPPESRQSGAAVYSATKAGVIAFTQALAQELGPHGIRVNAVAPGRNESRAKPLAKMIEMQQAEEAREPGSGRESPLTRPFGKPSDIGDAVAFLLSPEADYITGCCLDLTGGIRLH